MPPKRTTTTTTPMTDAAIKALIAQGVSTALAEYEANRGSGNGDDSHDSGSGRKTERAARECTYSDFLKCQPFNFRGTEGVVGLTYLSNGKIVGRAYTDGLGRKESNTEDLNLVTQNATTIMIWTVCSNVNNNARRWPPGHDAEVQCYFGHYKKDFPKLKNNNRGNQVGNGGATARAYAVGMHGKTRTPMSLRLGIFDVIIGMDWLVKCHDVIVCDEKIVRIPYGNEILIVCGDGSNNGHESRLNIISCTKTQKYLLKGCDVFLAHVTTKKAEDKSEEKRLKDAPIV
ncbi:hypothetical protein Tco_1418355 [Tanacetum coccineum]